MRMGMRIEVLGVGFVRRDGWGDIFGLSTGKSRVMMSDSV